MEFIIIVILLIILGFCFCKRRRDTLVPNKDVGTDLEFNEDENEEKDFDEIDEKTNLNRKTFRYLPRPITERI